MVPEQKIDLLDIFVLGLKECLKVATQQWELKIREEPHTNDLKKEFDFLLAFMNQVALGQTLYFRAAKYEKDVVLGSALVLAIISV